MNKELSKELMLLCNMEIKEISTCSYFNEANFNISIGNDICEHVDDANFKCEDCICRNEAYELVIDFTEPYNFVKLMEMKVDDTRLGAIINVKYTFQDRNSFLQCLINYLNRNEGLVNLIKDKIKEEFEGLW